MTKEEAIWYLVPIAASASLERYKEALTMAIDALKGQNVDRWIPVAERMPEKSGYFLCYWNGHTCRCKYFRPHGCFLFNGRQVKVTHWMPLPEPPKEAP